MADQKLKNKLIAEQGLKISNQPVDKALIINSTGDVISSDITSTELEYLSGVTSDIQTQINTVSTNLANYITESTPSKNPTFTYTGEVLTRIDYASDSSYKLFTYTGEFLTRIDKVFVDKTIRKDFNYTSGILTSISETVI